MDAQQLEVLRIGLQKSFDLLLKRENRIQIGDPSQFPFGWRKAGKGRTVWRIIEELITQNLEKYFDEFELDSIKTSNSEVSVFDFECKVKGNSTPIFINIKSAVVGGKKSKDDISKGVGLKEFYNEDPNRVFFVGTFFIQFKNDMTVEIVDSVVFPIAWIKDVYINPSNNGNLQSAYYKNIKDAIRRSNDEFLPIFNAELAFAQAKKKAKSGEIISNGQGNLYKKINSRWTEVDAQGNVI